MINLISFKKVSRLSNKMGIGDTSIINSMDNKVLHTHQLN